MPSPAITVEALGKAYRIGLKDEIPDTLVGAATGWAKAPLRNFQNLRRLNTFTTCDDDQPDLIWALRDVSFEVPEGEVLGVIGRNGAGKSTLLKILSRITEPTSGRATIHGRVSSLLEVGTGFHQELSGRENIYMNGTILGMRKREIDRKLEQIIDFSGVEKFLDTPIKRYSSGMKVRLAFAVAAHLEPEILIIDEVLAVGDAEFQKKCLGKMHDVATGGRTVLFVSHNMAAVEGLCTRAVVLKNGGKVFDGDVYSAIDLHISDTCPQRTGIAETRHSKCGTVHVHGASLDYVDQNVVIVVDAELSERKPLIGVGFDIKTSRGMRVMSQGAVHNGSCVANAFGPIQFRLELLNMVNALNGGQYSIDLWLAHPGMDKFVDMESALLFDIPFKDPTRSGKTLDAEKNGPVYLQVSATVNGCKMSDDP